MSSESKQPEKPIPAWVFMLALVICITGLGALQFSRQIKRRAEPVISEIHTLNQTGLRDGDDELSDWIEIWNPTDQPIELTGYFLSDDFRELQKWRFPKRMLAPGQFLVVFASGKDVAREFGALHTNFRLRPEGEYLALVAPNGKRIVHEFLPKYPPQYGDISFGIRPEIFRENRARFSGKMRDMSFLLSPTPGAPNDIEMLGLVADTKFSLRRGFLFSSTNVSLSVRTHGADIRYTLDGSTPGETHGLLYQGPIAIDRTITLRATAVRPGFKPSNADSHTYIFPEQVAQGLGSNPAADEFEQFVKGLLEVPSISLIIPKTSVPRRTGAFRDVAASMEIVDPVDNGGAQVDCGVRLSELGPVFFGSAYKNSFHLKFDSEFGDPEFKYPLFGKRKPRAFRNLILWGGTGSITSGTSLAAVLSDAWIRTTTTDVGRSSSRSRFVHVYLNGSYNGLYSVMESPDSPFMSTVPGTEVPQFDVRSGLTVLAGDSIAWNTLFENIRLQESTPEPRELSGRDLDMQSFIDFMLVQLFTGTANLGRNGNWMAVHPRSITGPFEFVATVNPVPMTDWSVDQIPFDDMLSPARLFQVLRQDPRFREQFARRAAELLGSGGALSEEQAVDRFRSVLEPIKGAAAVESLRWKGSGADDLKTFLEKRPGEFKRQLESAGLWN